jgi:hypothetical protein
MNHSYLTVTRRSDRKQLDISQLLSQVENLRDTDREHRAKVCVLAPRRTYIIDFASVVLIYLDIYNPSKADEKPFRNRDKRVVSYLYYNLTLTRGRIKAEEVLYGNKIEYFYVFN